LAQDPDAGGFPPASVTISLRDTEPEYNGQAFDLIGDFFDLVLLQKQVPVHEKHGHEVTSVEWKETLTTDKATCSRECTAV